MNRAPNSATPRVLIAGAGQRVFRSILPALMGASIAPRNVTLLSRRKTDGNIDGISHINSTDALGAEHFDWTLNCVPAEAMPSIQQTLFDAFPNARHFCDTPGGASLQAIRTIEKAVEGRPLWSLEDWGLLPNFQSAQAALDGRANRLVIHHFGIPIHFLALCRTLAKGTITVMKVPRRLDVFGGDFRATQIFPKDFNKAKAVWDSPTGRLHDSLALKTRVTDQDQLVREFGSDFVVYSASGKIVSELRFAPELMEKFGAVETRQDVHELEKTLALNVLFRNAISGNDCEAYSFANTLRDATSCAQVMRWRLWRVGAVAKASSGQTK